MKALRGVYRLLLQPWRLALLLGLVIVVFAMCGREHEEDHEAVGELAVLGLEADVINAEDWLMGKGPDGFLERAGAPYKGSYNEEPNIPAQCWIETGYGTQNACKYCHTDYLTMARHGNAFDIGEDQILYSFPTANLNRILWRNIIYPNEIEERLNAEGVALPGHDDVDYVRNDNWRAAFAMARGNGNTEWVNLEDPDSEWILFPALNPDHLFPLNPSDPTGSGTHGYVDIEGFVRDERAQYTGWRAINFFPYTIFTPLTGSVSGIYIRLPKAFMTKDSALDLEVYKQNLDLLERNIKNLRPEESVYYGDASGVDVQKGFYPVGTEFAHPLHYVDLLADGQMGAELDGAMVAGGMDYEFPGTRSKRVKEIRYMYKWKAVDLDDIAIDEEEEEEGEHYAEFVGREGQGWVDNDGGWIISAYIEDRFGNLRPQTTEELAQCVGCHANVGNTVDAVWSFQRKLPGEKGWTEMDYGKYNSATPQYTWLNDYLHQESQMGELGYFYYTVVGANLYGVMPEEIRQELSSYATELSEEDMLELNFPALECLDDEVLKFMSLEERRARLLERQRIMRQYARDAAYLYYDEEQDEWFIKGSVFYPTENTMKNNIALYRRIVLDQSYNLGKDVFGTESGHVPFTFRSDGNVEAEDGTLIPVGEVIASRPWDEDGVGTTPTGIVAVNEAGEPVDEDGNPVGKEYYKAAGHVTRGGTFDMMYNPMLNDIPFRKEK
ncbi:MAG: hypothetical protein V2I46_13610 [Bacteroides sp.]|jgi:hypothetical protein|nr:hypothetical protein [Bacteroides sp.]